MLVPVAAFAQELPEAGWLARKTAQDYRQAARYPEWSKVLPQGAEDPIRAERRPTEVSVGKPGEPGLAVWGRQVSYESLDAVEFYATAEGAEVLAVTGEILSRDREPVGSLQFHDDGARFDKSAQDGVYSARASWLKDLRPPELAENYLVKVRATFADGTTQNVTTGFLYSRPWASLVGRYRDRVDRDGNVVVRARVDVSKAGRFYLAGTLHTLDGEPIGTAQNAVELEPGKHWVDLTFYGLMFHDRGVAGPFKLGTLELRTTGGMPNALSDLATDVHTTGGVPLKGLRAKPFGDAGLLAAAERLEAEAARSRGE